MLLALSTLAQAQNWEQVGTLMEVNREARALYVDTANDYLYVGGQFFKMKGQRPVGTFSLLRIKNGKEEVLDSVYNNTVYTIYPYKGDIYIGGDFEVVGGTSITDSSGVKTTGGKTSYHLARLHNDTFETVNPHKRDPWVRALTEYNGNLIVGGIFSSFGGIQSHGVVAYNGTSFLPLDGGIMQEDTLGQVYSLHPYQGKLFAGGNFYAEKPRNTIDWRTRNLQMYDAQQWHRVDGWKSETRIGDISSMVVYKNELYIAGLFWEKTGDLANNILKYDGTYFYSLGKGVQNNYIRKMHVHNNQLLVCGGFNNAGDVPAHNIAKWDGVRWCSLSNDVFNNNIFDMETYRDSLYILFGGDTISGKRVARLAKWVGDSSMEDSCAPPAEIKKVNYNLGFSPNQLTEFKFNIYPNPVSDRLVVEKLKNAGVFNYSLLDINGKEISSGTLTESSTEIDISKVNLGLYFIHIYNKQETLTKKIVKE